jgi:hypothetical protein
MPPAMEGGVSTWIDYQKRKGREGRNGGRVCKERVSSEGDAASGEWGWKRETKRMRGGKVDALPPPLPKPQPSEKNSQDKQLTPLPKLNPRLRLVAGQVRRHAHAHGGLHAREEEHARGRGDEQPRARARPGPVLGVPRAPGCGCLVAATVALAR